MANVKKIYIYIYIYMQCVLKMQYIFLLHKYIKLISYVHSCMWIKVFKKFVAPCKNFYFTLFFILVLQLLVSVLAINLSLAIGSHELLRLIPQTDKQEGWITYLSPSKSKLSKPLKTVTRWQINCWLATWMRGGILEEQ